MLTFARINLCRLCCQSHLVGSLFNKLVQFKQHEFRASFISKFVYIFLFGRIDSDRRRILYSRVRKRPRSWQTESHIIRKETVLFVSGHTVREAANRQAQIQSKIERFRKTKKLSWIVHFARIFQAPQKIDPWTGTLDAFEFGNDCVQSVFLQNTVFGHEDCLFINVYVPAKCSAMNSTDKLPVMLYIYGGQLNFGSASFYGPDFLMDEDVIVVCYSKSCISIRFCISFCFCNQKHSFF